MSLVGFMNGAANTYRRIDGNLDLHYGRIPEIDARLAGVREKSQKQIEELLEFIDGVMAEEAKKKVYKSILLKMGSEGPEYIPREIEKMERYVKNSQFAPTKRTFFKIRNNILHAFVEGDADGVGSHNSNGQGENDSSELYSLY